MFTTALIGLLLMPLLQEPRPGPPTGLLLRNVRVVQVRDGTIRPAQSVLVRGDRIVAVGPMTSVTESPDAQVVDGGGAFLIPGLWDMHVHFSAFDEHAHTRDFALYIANGVTGVRLMGGWPAEAVSALRGVREQIRSGALVGPRLVLTGPIVDGPHKMPAEIGTLSVAGPGDAPSVIDSLVGLGVDFIKLYDNLDRASYFAVAAEARRRGVPFAGHVPRLVGVAEASDAGQRSIEHSTGILVACSSERANLLRRYASAFAEPDFSLANLEGSRVDGRAAATFSAPVCRELSRRLRRNGTWQTPTLVTQSYALDASAPADPRRVYIPSGTVEQWDDPESDPFLKLFTSEDHARRRAVYRALLHAAGFMHREGAPFLAGTDVGRPYVFPGFSLHDELALLVEAGFTPLAALQAATLGPARFLGREQDLGSVEPGRLADLVLLEEDPLEHIGNTRRIRAVVAGGRLFGAGAIRHLLDGARAAAGDQR